LTRFGVTIYGYSAATGEKLIAKARRSPQNIRFEEFETLLRHAGWAFDRQAGSHRIWISTARFRLSIQETSGNAKAYQVRQFLAQYDREAKA
jgi:hypothetical protein